MLRVWTDFNSRTKDGECSILFYKGTEVSNDLLSVGDRVILFQDEGDFEVEANICFKFVDETQRNSWVAKPDWSTIKRSLSATDAAQ